MSLSLHKIKFDYTIKLAPKKEREILKMEKFLYKRLDKKEPKMNLWFMYPAIESFAMASLGYLSIFKMFDLDYEIYSERVYFDSKTTQIPSKLVDSVGFSVSFELDILSIIKMLKKYDFPLHAKERGEDDPIVFGGGPVLMSNPKAFEDLFDFISIGEMSCLSFAMDILKKRKEENLTRVWALEELSKLDGIYVPSFPKEKVEIVRDKIEDNPIYTPILSEKSFFKDTFVIELERGCPKMCNFCLASWLNLPVRFVKFEKIIEALDFGLQYTNKIALLGAYVAGHPKFKEIIEYISKKAKENPIELSISSLRADLADEKLMETLVLCGQKTATIALEAGSQRLRDFIKKDLTDEQILNTLNAAQKAGLRGMKIYLMLGLPEEKESDLEELIALMKKVKAQIKENKTPFEITLSASTFIPKPHTPFENMPREDKKSLEKKIKFLQKNLHQMGINFKVSSIEWDIFQTILSTHQESLVDFLIEVVEKGGNLGAFKQLWRKYNKEKEKNIKEGHLLNANKCAALPFNNNKVLNWSFISCGASDLKAKRQNECLRELGLMEN